jgi:RNA polymerase sigma-70 factor (ECF subfamily)
LVCVVSLDPLEEGTLIERARAGDARAFCNLVRVHGGGVRVYIAYHVRRDDVVDDLAQEVFLIAFRKLPEFDAAYPLRPWLLGIARRAVLKYLRDDGRRAARHTGAFASLFDEWRTALVETATDVDAGERRVAALMACVDSLPAHSAELVSGHYFDALPLVEIASRQSRKQGAVRIALFRIRQALRDCVERRLAEPAV